MKPIKIKVIFMGTSSFAAAALESLAEKKYDIISVYTQPGFSKEKNGKPKESEVKKVAEKYKLGVFEPKKLDEAVIEEIKKQKPDLIIVASYGKILPKNLLEIPGFGSINVHASMLPKFRGPSPIQNALLEGEKETGTTIMLMDEGIDTGDILAQKKILIKPEETYLELFSRMAKISAELLLETLPLWVERKISSKKQNEKEATYCQMIERQDGQIIWSSSAQDIFNQWRALTPWPGIFSYWNRNGSDIRIKFHKISFSPKSAEENKREGEIFKKDFRIAVQSGEGLIFIEELQMEGKNRVKIEEFINGYSDFIGSILK